MVLENLKRILHEKFQRSVRKTEIDGEIVYWKKTGFIIKDWQRVYPPVREDGTKWNVQALIFGSKQNFIRVSIYFILVMLVIFAFKEYTNSLTAFLKQPTVISCLERIGYTIK